MNYLLIETSSDQSFVILIKGKKNLQSKFLLPTQQSPYLLPIIQELFERNNLRLENLDFIAIGIGPGSFTGTRMGVITAKSLSFAKHIPLVPFCSLKMFVPEQEGSFLTVCDAKSQGAYVLQGEKKGDSVTFQDPPLLLSFAALDPLITKVDQVLSPHTDKLKSYFPSITTPWIQMQPNPSYLISLLQNLFLETKGVSHLDVQVNYGS